MTSSAPHGVPHGPRASGAGLGLPRYVGRLITSGECAGCQRFPCECVREARTEMCACSRSLVEVPDEQMAILNAVRAHQATPEHRAWRERMGL